MNTVEKILPYLDSLGGLHRLIELRQICANRQDKPGRRYEAMGSFVILGRYWADAGNFMIIEDRHTDPRDRWALDQVPDVVSTDDLRAMLPNLWISGTGYSPPKPEDSCAECGRGWGLRNSHDSIAVRSPGSDDRSLYHRECDALRRERGIFEFYRRVLASAGLEKACLAPIPNEYGGPENDREPWAIARLPGGSIKMGWRRHVFNLCWLGVVERRRADIEVDKKRGKTLEERGREIEVELSAESLFPGETATTRGDTYIHAHGEAKIVEYLTTLRKRLFSGVVEREAEK